MRSKGYGTWSVGRSVCLSVCLSVRASSRTTGYEAANEWHQQVVNKEKMDTDFPKTTAFQRYFVKTSERGNVRSIAHPLRQAT